ncbi:hypothetical protein [Roseomonas sp. AR75]|uniref:hypothetical protein n=1 Tax=Roseomonas sp. AR75 TaxID=2562311 RepID=UPI0014854A0C|nr:hypothetical protein [Roseomonas sp. AR75]
MEGRRRSDAWSEWKRLNEGKIAHPYGYEEKFVDTVLRQIPGLDPCDVIPQYRFVCDKGINRRIDFMIVNKHKGYSLPVELDGAEKGEARNKWSDFLERQNAIVRSFGTILRYSNLKMLNDPDFIAREIEEIMSVQAAHKRASDSRRGIIEIVGSTSKSSGSGLETAPLQSATLTVQSVKPPLSVSLPFSAHVFGFALILVASVVYFVWQGGTRVLTPDMASAVSGATLTSMNRVASAISAEPAVSTSQFDPIQAFQAKTHIGEIRAVCGHVAEIKEISAGLFINFDRPYPQETFSIVIWREKMSDVGRLDIWRGRHLCVSGLIRTYRNKPRIEVARREQLIQ